jgi:hypothetical protein
VTRKLVTSHVGDAQRAIIGEWWTDEIITNQYVPDDKVYIIDTDALDVILAPEWIWE